MRVYVEHDMTVNHSTSVVSLKAGQIIEGPLAVYLVESNCDVTIEQDDRPAAEEAPAATETPAVEPSYTPGSGEQAEGAEPTAEPGAAE